jgi:hypothetical protein
VPNKALEAQENQKEEEVMKSIFGTIAILAITTLSHATIINIPDDYQTIYNGLYNSTPGCTLLVAPGIYEEAEALRPDTDRVILGSTGNPEDVVISGPSSEIVVYLLRDGVVIENVTISNGAHGVFSGEGRGISSRDSPV